MSDIYESKFTGTEIDFLLEKIKNLKIEDITPVSNIISYMGNVAPDNYLICDGTEYNISDYQILANHILKEFGSYNYFGGDGSLTFAVPDLRGEFLRGTGTNNHSNQGNGADVGIHQDATVFPDIGKSSSGSARIQINHTVNTLREEEYASNRDYKFYKTRKGYTFVDGSSANSPYSLYGSFTSRPTNTSVLYCIKYK